MTEIEAISFQNEFFALNPTIKGVIEMVTNVPALSVYVKNTDSEYVFSNPQHRVIYDRIEWHQITGRRASDFFPPLLGSAYEANDRQIFETQKPLENEIWLVPTIRGTPRWFLSNKTPLFASDESLIGLMGILSPIATPEDQMLQFGDLKKVIEFIDSHFVDEINAESLAQIAGLSIAQFNRKFKQLLRLAPMEYVNSLRIQKAQQLLSTTRRSIGRIATETGFYDQSHFTKRFRQMTGMTPLKYRKEYREG